MRWLPLFLLLVGSLTGQAQTEAGRGRANSNYPALPAVSRLANATEVRKRLGLTPEYAGVVRLEAVKVAVLDYGFAGLDQGKPYLPASAEVVEHYSPEFIRRYDLGDPNYQIPLDPLNKHGRGMAQIIWAVTGSNPGGPKFYLLNASGPTMLRRAVRYAIERKVDLILFSGWFEGGGNGDGRGPINQVVSQATSAGIPWINAAGNTGMRVYNGPVRVLNDGYLKLRDGKDIASLRFRNHADENTVTVTLSWNDYRETEDAGSNKDLDLYVEDWAGRIVGSSQKRQIVGTEAAGTEETRNPRERLILANLPASPTVPSDPDYCYRIRIKAPRGGFSASTDRLRVLVAATREAYVAPGNDAPRPALEFLDASGEEELYPPADHPLVLTVGDDDRASALGPTLDRRVKPDTILADSRAYFTDGEVTAGSSNAAAYVAGVVAVLKATNPMLQPADLLRIARQGPLMSASSIKGRPVKARGGVTPSFHLWQTPTQGKLNELLRTRR